MTASVLRAVERFLLPNVCVACERPIEQSRPDSLVCRMCRSRMTAVVGGCARCRQLLPPVGPCRFCAGWPDSLSWVRSGVWLSDEAREIVHHLKYEGYRAIAPEIADIIARRIPQPPRGILTPIPLGRRRLASRGYNQAAEIARALAAGWNLPLSESLLRRTRDTKTQTALAPEEREVNVSGAFQASPRTAVNEGAAGVVRAVILVDDVLTTGATIAAAARSLEAAGWEEIGAVTFARALPFAGRAGS